MPAQPSTARHSPAQPSTAHPSPSPAQHGTVQHSPAQPSPARHSPAQHALRTCRVPRRMREGSSRAVWYAVPSKMKAMSMPAPENAGRRVEDAAADQVLMQGQACNALPMQPQCCSTELNSGPGTPQPTGKQDLTSQPQTHPAALRSGGRRTCGSPKGKKKQQPTRQRSVVAVGEHAVVGVGGDEACTNKSSGENNAAAR